MENRNTRILPFWYVVSASLTALGSTTSVLTLAQDSDFELHGFLASSSRDADTDIMPNNFTVLIKDVSTGRQLSNAALPQRVLCAPANGGFYRCWRPVRFTALSMLEFTFTDLDNNTNVVTLVMQGVKILI